MEGSIEVELPNLQASQVGQSSPDKRPSPLEGFPSYQKQKSRYQGEDEEEKKEDGHIEEQEESYDDEEEESEDSEQSQSEDSDEASKIGEAIDPNA
mmetsp:Transcript_34660/g.53056  ORF Transcript_34660/g.53056 Transcript_34660/m.53056 type:complete len:96 (-) Transcript_34660:180-467(-)|eukprot:CAMPEP_0170492480 /NCGR_PEP_ID=MMETSP0208-20121228/12320_1 /TAXON_ID=197538 /ORGANISM="Strombidium inclinatum, Strain S3" /LENGTH=95 /DNA_ID=CAMNT_0010768229 /DNA_START=1490 /DNA_END=1777 /DNA_ORIENTATION=-